LFERLTCEFRLFLKALDGTACPLCAVQSALERKLSKPARVDQRAGAPLCRRHLDAHLAGLSDRSSKVWYTRAVLEALMGGTQPCAVCARLDAAELRLARSIRRLDARMRFRRALEDAPLFCRRHESLVAADGAAKNFVDVQRVKLEGLRDALAQAVLRGSDEVDALIGSVLAYLGQPCAAQSPTLDTDVSTGSARTEDGLFEAWASARQLQRLGNLEAEAASLRYRTATLSEENRRLKLALAAVEAMCRDLQKDRAELLAAKRGSDSTRSERQRDGDASTGQRKET
jgi:hypothetical protein